MISAEDILPIIVLTSAREPAIVHEPHPFQPDHLDDPRALDLLTPLAYSGQLVRQVVEIPESDQAVVVIRPADIDSLLDQSEDDPEQNLPYWAAIWPSGIALASAILAEPERIAGQPVFELGSGVGITAAIAMQAGADLTATDYAAESLALTRLTCRLHTGREPGTRQINWRASTADLLQSDGSAWPIVLAADVLYEQRDVDPVLDILDRIVAPGGLVWFAEQGRRPGRDALARLRQRGWRISSRTFNGPWPDPMDAGVIVGVHELRPPPPGIDKRRS